MHTRWMLVLAVILAASALADSRGEALADALSDAKEARDEADRASSTCRKKVYAKADDLVDRLSDVKASPDADGLSAARKKAQALADLADDHCKASEAKRITKPLGRAVAALETAADAKPQASAPEKRSGGVLDVAVNIAGGLGGLFGGGSAQSSSSSSKSVSSSRTETINGQPVGDDDDDDDAEDERPAKKKKSKKSAPAKGEFGATCQHNSDCDSNTCFVGSGNLGYCTKMCNSWSECPSFWECKRAANAPQTICMQGR